MNAYAQNSGGGYASLTSSLLARKGEAMPAVDAMAHEGVDIEMRPLKPANSPGAPKQISEDTISRLYEDGSGPEHSEGLRRRARPVRLVHPAPEAEAAMPAAGAWTPRMRAGQAAGQAAGQGAPKLIEAKPAGAGETPLSAAARAALFARRAIVTLRMPARDLVRLRLASRELGMSCQAIILEALGCYLDANDAPAAEDDPAIIAETERMLARSKTR